MVTSAHTSAASRRSELPSIMYHSNRLAFIMIANEPCSSIVTLIHTHTSVQIVPALMCCVELLFD